MQNSYKMKKTAIIYFLLSFAFLFSGEFLQARNTVGGFTFKAKPLPEYRYFPIIDFGYSWRIIGNDSANTLTPAIYTAELAIMHNLSRSSAVGLSISMFYCDESYFGFGAHYRRWIDRDNAVDFSPRVLAFSSVPTFSFPSFGLGISWSHRELVSVNLMIHRMFYQNYVIGPPFANATNIEKVRRTHLSLGISGRSYAATAIGAGTFLFYIIRELSSDQ